MRTEPVGACAPSRGGSGTARTVGASDANAAVIAAALLITSLHFTVARHRQPPRTCMARFGQVAARGFDAPMRPTRATLVVAKKTLIDQWRRELAERRDGRTFADPQHLRCAADVTLLLYFSRLCICGAQ